MIGNLGWAVRRLFAPEWRLVAVSGLLMIISTVLPALQPVLSGRIVNALVADGLGPSVWWPTALMAATLLLPRLATTASSLPRVILEERTVRRLDRMVIDAGAAMPDIGALERPAIHDRLHLVSDNLVACMRIPQQTLMALSAVAGVITLLVSLGSLTWWLPLLLVAAAVPHMIGERRMITVRHDTMRSQSRRTREMDYCLTAASEPQLAKEVRAFGLGDYFLRRFDSRSGPGLAELAAVRLRSSRVSAVGAVGYAVAVVVSFGYVAWMAVAGRMSAGDIALYLTAITSLFVALFGLALSGTGVLEALNRLTAVRELATDARPGIAITEPGTPMPPRLSTGIKLSGVRFDYRSGLDGTGRREAGDHRPADEVLRGIDLELPAGQVTALVGENGEGKSTLVKLLTRMYDPTGGSITADGIGLADYDLAGLRSRIATVYQDHGRFALTFAENIAIGTPERLEPGVDSDQRRKLIMEAVDKGGADTVLAKLPGGLDTELTRRFGGVDLSGGEWQRVATARAFLPDAALIILDEPTSALDVDAERRLFERFAELVRGRTAVMISHRFSTVRNADQIAVLSGGRIAECGSHDDLMDRDGHYAELFNLQADRYRL